MYAVAGKLRQITRTENVAALLPMDLSGFFQALPTQSFTSASQADPKLGHQVVMHASEFPDWHQADIIFFSASVLDHDRLPVALRKELYSLSALAPGLNMADLGHMTPRDRSDDVLEQLRFLLNLFQEAGKICVMILDRPFLSLAQSYALEGRIKDAEVVHIDSQCNVRDSDLRLDDQSYHHALLREPPAFLFEFTQLGHQRYFVSETQLAWFQHRNFALHRYGELMGHIDLAEPYLRTAHVVSTDMSAVRASDAPAACVPSPGGFSTEEFCRMARYAGLGHRIQSFSLSGIDPEWDPRGITSRLAAMGIWYFLEGHLNSFDDLPMEDRRNMTRYSVQLHASIPRIDFFRHARSNRWWMEVPYQDQLGVSEPKTRLISCSEQDYETAKNDEIPDRWWLTYHKLPQPE